ncbi:hypothetical protein ACQKPE_16235 [Pseudomonas sp. NPDC089554]|uniref:hypothetical protein n=1 Tax=Pseudomonas sp. NPDC089554 TaxID=3390653 RepID=UPI003D07F018
MTDQNKRWDGLTIKGQLEIGVWYAGMRHKEFTLRVAVAGDMVVAQQQHPEGPLQLITVEVYRRQLLSLGEIPAEALTTELLLDELTETDLALISDADITLEKKLKPQKAAAPATGAASSTPS